MSLTPVGTLQSGSCPAGQCCVWAFWLRDCVSMLDVAQCAHQHSQPRACARLKVQQAYCISIQDAAGAASTCSKHTAQKPWQHHHLLQGGTLPAPHPAGCRTHLRLCQLIDQGVAAVLVPVALEDAVGCLQHTVDDCNVSIGTCRSSTTATEDRCVLQSKTVKVM